MKNIVFRNFDKYAIKHLLTTIGEHTLHKECELKKLQFPKRLSMFFMETSEYHTVLKYVYHGSREAVTVMVIDRYQLPEYGWIRTVLQ